MTLELLPRLVGGLTALLAVWLLADAVLPDRPRDAGAPERRRRIRSERSRAGEGALGLGFAAFATALIADDTWRWGTVAMLAGGGLLLAGLVLNRRVLAEALLHRGAARRGRSAAGRRHEPRPDATGDRRTTAMDDAPGRVDAPGIFPP